MMNASKGFRIREIKPAALRLARYLGSTAFVCILALQPACLFKSNTKAKAPQAPPAAVRIALLPFNVPADNADLRWVSLAAPLVMAKTIENLPSFEIVPVWQAFPVAIESLGAGRTITPEVAAYVADRVGAKWATDGELASSKDGVWLRVDFIPAKTSLVPYRFEKVMRLESMGVNSYAAFSQLANYLVLRPLPKLEGKGVNANSMREIAEAMDHEYGWFVTADPGKSEKLASTLAKSDTQFARLLFDPILYPVVGPVAAKPKSVEIKPTVPENPEKQGVPETPRPATSEAQAAPQPSQTVAPPTQTQPALVETPAPTPPPVSPAATQPGQPAASEEKPSAQPSANPPATTTTQPGPPRKATPPATKRQSSPPALQSRIPPSVAPPEKPAATKAGEGQFQIQVYSSQSKKEADATAASLTKAGFSAKVDQVDLKEKGIWYRIRLQGFKTREEAKAAGDKLVADKTIEQYWIVQ